MKKLVMALVLTAFAGTSVAAYACDGMKGHEKASSDTQAKKEKKESGSKADQKS